MTFRISRLSFESIFSYGLKNSISHTCWVGEGEGKEDHFRRFKILD